MIENTILSKVFPYSRKDLKKEIQTLLKYNYITMKVIPYIGNGAYCYSNSIAMLLASTGENISPSKIEVLSGVGLDAAHLKKKTLI